jgi:hypothetical protein
VDDLQKRFVDGDIDKYFNQLSIHLHFGVQGEENYCRCYVVQLLTVTSSWRDFRVSPFYRHFLNIPIETSSRLTQIILYTNFVNKNFTMDAMRGAGEEFRLESRGKKNSSCLTVAPIVLLLNIIWYGHHYT